AIGQGASSQAQASIANMGNNMLFVMSGSNNTGGMRGGAGSSNTLTPDDAAAIATDCPAVRAVSPGVRANGQLVFGNQNWIASSGIQGANEKFPDIRSWPVATGEFFTEGDVRTAARVCVIGKRSGWPHDANPQPSVPSDRRAHHKRTEPVRPGSGRHRHSSLYRRSEE